MPGRPRTARWHLRCRGGQGGRGRGPLVQRPDAAATRVLSKTPKWLRQDGLDRERSPPARSARGRRRTAVAVFAGKGLPPWLYRPECGTSGPDSTTSADRPEPAPARSNRAARLRRGIRPPLAGFPLPPWGPPVWGPPRAFF